MAGAVGAFWPGAVTKFFSDDYMAHGYCFFWNRELVTLHVISDTAIALAYVCIAATLTVLFLRERRRLPVAGIFAAFGIFIVACGLTHAMDVVVLWRPFYWISGDLKLVTALSSVTTAIVLPSLLPRIHRLIEAARTSRTNERLFLAASDRSSDSFFILESVRDAAGEIVDFRFAYLNINGARLLSSTPQEMQGKLLCERYPASRTDGFFERYKRVVETGESLKAEFPIAAREIQANWMTQQVVKLEDGVAITAYDITDAKQKELLMVYLAQHDSLTGLAQRGLFDERLDAALRRAPECGHSVGVVVVDCDHFKHVNDLRGHQTGDVLLTEVAMRLQAGVGEGDTVARMGGDEFLIVLDNLADPQHALRVATGLLQAIQRPVTIGGHELQVTASIGVSIYPRDGATATELLKNADAAMYRAKAAGRNRVQAFTPQMASSLARRRELEAALQTALADNEFALVYQPRVDLATGLVIGVEALLRWHSRQLGLVMPTEFIPIIEDNGLIVPIGLWVIETACRELQQLCRDLGRELLLAVNVSPRQFQEDTLAADIQATLLRQQFPARSLEIEITENLLLRESSHVLEAVESIRALGVAIAIDDFGTGYSSMSYLMRFRVERLKIDQSFVRRMTSDADSGAICKAIIGLAKALNMAVVAEGVESAWHRDLLCGLGCEEAQGHFYSEPVPVEELAAAIERIQQLEMRLFAA